MQVYRNKSFQEIQDNYVKGTKRTPPTRLNMRDFYFDL
jgi:hypothetical protein